MINFCWKSEFLFIFTANLSFDPDTFLKNDQPELLLNTQVTNLSQTKLKQPNCEVSFVS